MNNTKLKNVTFIKITSIILSIVFIFTTFFTFGSETQIDIYAQVGGQCRFDQASCTWDPVDGATAYSLTITEEETNTIIKQEQISAGTTKYKFPITANRTYRCDVSAKNECGTLGPAGSASALCAAEGLATPAPSVAPVATPVPTVAPTKAPVVVSCGSSCNTQSDCQSGLTCLKIGNDSYCAKPEYQAACIQNPSIASCCQPPKPQPTELPKSGLIEDTVTIILLGVVFAVLGFGGILLTSRKRR